jgi:hypothetical protein
MKTISTEGAVSGTVLPGAVTNLIPLPHAGCHPGGAGPQLRDPLATMGEFDQVGQLSRGNGRVRLNRPRPAALRDSPVRRTPLRAGGERVDRIGSAVAEPRDEEARSFVLTLPPSSPQVLSNPGKIPSGPRDRGAN